MMITMMVVVMRGSTAVVITVGGLFVDSPSLDQLICVVHVRNTINTHTGLDQQYVALWYLVVVVVVYPRSYMDLSCDRSATIQASK